MVGVSETSSYGALQNLLNAIGGSMRPAVRAILHPQTQGKGLPDGGLFTRDQLQQMGRDVEPQNALKVPPARGVLEVKGTSFNLQTLIDSKQVATYLSDNKKAVCTNYREFAVVELRDGKVHTLETFSFAPSEAAFWTATNDLAAFEREHGERLSAFLTRALLYGAPLATPQVVAAFMASCAREAKLRVEAAQVPALDRVKESLEAALNLSFPTDEADSFFRSSLVQTLFYGVFSAWILWGRDNPPGSGAKFDWRTSAYYLRVPVIQTLFYEVSNPQTLEALKVVEPLNWVTDALNRADRASFDANFSDGSAVQYFYEPFLAAFDPHLREQLGVWYTPASIVRYMVARVDAVLKSELGLADGLADERVVVLDPCCGTGGFLVEVIHHIATTLKERGQDALGADDLKRTVLSRLYGFELLTAPFVVAHLQLGLLLQTLGSPLSGNERAQIFLTNALTGWTEPDGDQLRIELPGLLAEKEAAEGVKRDARILVVLGNPPYSGYAGIAIGEERELTDAYRSRAALALPRFAGQELPRPEGQGLNELYVRFFRMAERKITEDTGEGVVCYISNYSWLDGKSHPVMRETYLNRFSDIWIDSLNGDRYRTGKVAPDGTPDPSIFSAPGNPQGIQVGTAISLMVKKPETEGTTLHYRDLWGTGKHAQLEAETQGTLQAEYAVLNSPVVLGLPFMPTRTSAHYTSWPLLPDLFPVSFPGVKTSRDDVVVDIDRERLVARMTAYFDKNVSDEQMRVVSPRAMESVSRFNAVEARQRLQARGFLPQNTVRYTYRPFDVRWLYWEPETKLLDEKRTDYWPHVFEGNTWMESRSRTPQLTFDRGLSTSYMGDNMGNGLSLYFPLYLRDQIAAQLFDEGGEIPKKPNLSTRTQSYLKAVESTPPVLFHHALAVQHSPRYRQENADALRLAWPRIPLPATSEVLSASGALGLTVAALLDVLKPVVGVSSGTPRPELRALGGIARRDGGNLNVDGGELGMTVNWGYRAATGIMPGNGRAVEREWDAAELALIDEGAAALGLDRATALQHLGTTTFDVYLNEVAYWKGVPARAWQYTMGGYRVFKKWLSYRTADVLGRDLTVAEAREATAIVRRIAALLLLEPQLDANYAACAAAVWTPPEATGAVKK